MRWIAYVVLLLTLAITCSAVSADQARSRVTGMYTDMRYVAEAGDVVGTEIFVVAGLHGGQAVNYFVYCQTSHGMPDPPVLVPATVSGPKLEFELPMPWGRFIGDVVGNAIVGEFQGNKTRVRLLRGSSYWQ